MSKKPTKVYPTKGTYLRDVPRVVQVIETRGDADALIATGAFTDNPNDPARDHDVLDLTDPPRHPETGEPILPILPVPVIPEPDDDPAPTPAPTPASETSPVTPTEPAEG